MSLDEENLETAANGGLMDLEKWPNMVEPLLERLEYIIYNTFAMPQIPPEAPTAMTLDQPPLNPATSFIHDPSSIPSSSNKENAAPPDLQTPPRPPPSSIIPSSSTERIPDSQPASQIGCSNGDLPAPLLLLLDSIRSTMRSMFSSKPPHTIQRLAELILRPTCHYKTLPAYLRAVDRVVSVTSTADIFPLPLQASAPQINGMMNGSENTFVFADNLLGSDESLGGALLTPIPWLSNVASPDPDAAAVIDEGIPYHSHALRSTLNPSYGPLELREADSSNHPVSGAEPMEDQQQEMLQGTDTMQQQILPNHPGTVGIESEVMRDPSSLADEAEEIPHARGPSVLGVEDLGLQDGKGVQMTLLNTGDGEDTETSIHQPAPARPAQGAGADQTSATSTLNQGTDGDGDIALVDEPSTVLPTGSDNDQQT